MKRECKKSPDRKKAGIRKNTEYKLSCKSFKITINVEKHLFQNRCFSSYICLFAIAKSHLSTCESICFGIRSRFECEFLKHYFVKILANAQSISCVFALYCSKNSTPKLRQPKPMQNYFFFEAKGRSNTRYCKPDNKEKV